MRKHPAEIFGFPLSTTPATKKKYWCPYTDKKCNKQSRIIKYPMGVCSIQYGDQIIALCPRRFLQNHIVFKDIAEHYFGTRHNILVFSEIALKDVGTFDYVMVKHKPLSYEIEDFVIIEFQTGQTTGAGNLVRALRDFLNGKNVEGSTYNFGLNMADIWKRSFTQILNKGITVEQWKNKIYWVVQEPIYQNFVNRYNLDEMYYKEAHKTVFMIYDLKQQGSDIILYRTRVESSTIDDLFKAFRNSPNIPPKEDFKAKLRKRIETKRNYISVWNSIPAYSFIASSFCFMRALSALGSARPPVAFITCPTKKPMIFSLPLRYCSTSLGLFSMASST